MIIDRNLILFTKVFPYGIGESFMVRLQKWYDYNSICIQNGFQKSEWLWEQNSRVKLFKVYVVNNNEESFPLCLLSLEDNMGYQEVDISHAIYEFIVYYDLDKIDPAMMGLDSDFPQKGMILEFEINQVYKGEKWSDVSISGVSEFDDSCFGNGR